MYDAGKIAYIGGGDSPTANISILDLNEPTPLAIRGRAHGAAAPAEQRDNSGRRHCTDHWRLVDAGLEQPNGLVAQVRDLGSGHEEVTQVAEASGILSRLPFHRATAAGRPRAHHRRQPRRSGVYRTKERRDLLAAVPIQGTATDGDGGARRGRAGRHDLRRNAGRGRHRQSSHGRPWRRHARP